MSKKLAFLLAVILCFVCFESYLTADAEEIELTLPENFPNTFLGYYWIGGHDTNGATFIITEASCTKQEIKIKVLQLPNDSYTSLIDNQTEYPSDDRDYQNELGIAAQHGEKLIGTLCDIKEIIDENGNTIPFEYGVLLTRSGSSLISEFTIYLPQNLNATSLHLKICVGVNETLDSRFSMMDTMSIDISL